jgi:hypothetical protein
LKSVRLHCVKRFPSAGDAECNVSQSAAPAVLVNHLLHWRIRGQRFEQLNKVRTIPDPQQNFPHLVASAHLFPMDLLKTQHLVSSDLAVQIALLYGNGHMIHKKYARDIFQALISQASIGAAHGKSLSFVFRRREQLVCKNHSPKSLTTKATKVHEEKRPQIDFLRGTS